MAQERIGLSSRLLWGGALLLLFAAQGCVSLPLSGLARAPHAERVEILDPDYQPFRVSPVNRYALVLKGSSFEPPRGGGFAISSAEDILAGTQIHDPWVQGDVDQLSQLLLSKGYDVYFLDFGRVQPRSCLNLLERIAYVADAETRLFLAYSGEGDASGWRTRTLRLGENSHVVPPKVTITPSTLFEALAQVQGSKAMVINACEAGVFTEAAREQPEYQGVVIAACRRGTATTPHEPSGTTAIFAAFLGLYSQEPWREQNLARVEIDRAGGLWTNLAHHWKSLWRGGLPLSYQPVIFTRGDYWF